MIATRKIPACSIEELSKWQLFGALGGNAAITIGGVGCILRSIEREDGSGSKFNLCVRRDGIDHQVFCRTKD
jgi:hypothetical protein